MKEIIADLRARQADYEPNDSIKEALSRSAMVLVIGPTAIGKTTCIDLVTELDPDLKECRALRLA